jgi:glyceraldehyde-3-phosphate dehydrogenase (NADP+) (phosphorylating)
MLGTFKADVKIVDDTTIRADGKPITVVSSTEPLKLPWIELGINIVIEVQKHRNPPQCKMYIHVLVTADAVRLTVPNCVLKGTGVFVDGPGAGKHTAGSEPLTLRLGQLRWWA